MLWPKCEVEIEGVGSFMPRSVEVSGSIKDHDTRVRIEIPAFVEFKLTPAEPTVAVERRTKKIINAPSKEEAKKIVDRIIALEMEAGEMKKQAKKRVQEALIKTKQPVESTPIQPPRKSLLMPDLLKAKVKPRMVDLLGYGKSPDGLVKSGEIERAAGEAAETRVKKELEKLVEIQVPKQKGPWLTWEAVKYDERGQIVNERQLKEAYKNAYYQALWIEREAQIESEINQLKEKLRPEEQTFVEKGYRITYPGKRVAIYGWFEGLYKRRIFTGFLSKVNLLDRGVELVARCDWPLEKSNLKLSVANIKAYDWVVRVVEQSAPDYGLFGMIGKDFLDFTLTCAIAKESESTLDTLLNLKNSAEKFWKQKTKAKELELPFWFDHQGQFHWHPKCAPSVSKFLFKYGVNISKLRSKDDGFELETFYFPYVTWGETIWVEHPAVSTDLLVTSLTHRYQRGSCRTVMRLEGVA